MKPVLKRENPLREEEKAEKKKVPSLLSHNTIVNQQAVNQSSEYLSPVTYAEADTTHIERRRRTDRRQEVDGDEVCEEDRPSIRTVFTPTNKSGESHEASSNVRRGKRPWRLGQEQFNGEQARMAETLKLEEQRWKTTSTSRQEQLQKKNLYFIIIIVSVRNDLWRHDTQPTFGWSHDVNIAWSFDLCAVDLMKSVRHTAEKMSVLGC